MEMSSRQTIDIKVQHNALTPNPRKSTTGEEEKGHA